MKPTVFYTLFLGIFLAGGVAGQEPRLVLPVGHVAEIRYADFSPDGKYIATASNDQSVIIWDVKSGKMLHRMEGHKGYVNSVSFSPIEDYIVTSSTDGTAILWDFISGKIVHRFEGHVGFVNHVNSAFFSTDGKYIVTSSWDNTAIIWDVKNRLLVNRLMGHKGNVLSAIFSPNGSFVVTASTDGSAIVWDVNNGGKIFTLEGHTSNVKSAIFSPDGNRIVTASLDGNAIIWDANTGKLLQWLQGHKNSVNSAMFSPDSKYVVTTSNDKTANLWEVETGKLLHRLVKHKEWVDAARFSPDGKSIITASWDGSAIVWDIEGKIKQWLIGHKSSVIFAAFSPDGMNIVTCSYDNTSIIWDRRMGKKIRTLQGSTYSPYSANYSPTGKHLVVSSENGVVNIWDLQNNKPIDGFGRGVIRGVFAGFSPDGNKVISASKETANVWDTKTGKILYKLIGHTGSVYRPSFSVDGKLILTASWDSTVKIWDAKTGKEINTFKFYKSRVNDAKFSPDSKKIIITSNDKTAKIWDIEKANLVDSIKWKNGNSHSVNVSPDCKYLLITSFRNVAEIWHLEKRKLIDSLKWNGGYIWSGAYSPDGKRIVTASTDNRVVIWDSESGKVLYVIDGQTSRRTPPVFSPDSKILLTSEENGIMKFWNTERGELLYTLIIMNGKDYFLQTPIGYYQSTPDAAKLLHYVTKDLKIITFEQLDVKYNRPDKVLEAIGNTDTALIRSYRKAWEKRIKKLGIDTTQFRDGYSVPECDFANRDQIGAEQKTESLRLHVKASDSTYRLDRFNVWVNESPLFGQRGISIKKKNSNSLDTVINIKLSQGENRIECSITNANGTESYRMPLYVNYTPSVKQKESLRFIGIGIDKFSEKGHDLQYSVKDIRDLSVKLKEKYGNDIQIDTVFNEKVNSANIKALKNKLLQTSINDKVILAYSGHGLLSKDFDYYLSTYQVNFEKPEQNGLPYDELENLLDSIPARRKLMLIDACHSGEVDKEEMTRITGATDSLQQQGTKGGKPTYTGKTTLGMKNSFELMQSLFVNVGKSTGATVISAAAGTQFALERGDLKNGVFTYSILEAMNKYPAMKIRDLRRYVGERVLQLTNGLQQPTSRNEILSLDWNLW